MQRGKGGSSGLGPLPWGLWPCMFCPWPLCPPPPQVPGSFSLRMDTNRYPTETCSWPLPWNPTLAGAELTSAQKEEEEEKERKKLAR